MVGRGLIDVHGRLVSSSTEKPVQQSHRNKGRKLVLRTPETTLLTRVPRLPHGNPIDARGLCAPSCSSLPCTPYARPASTKLRLLLSFAACRGGILLSVVSNATPAPSRSDMLYATAPHVIIDTRRLIVKPGFSLFDRSIDLPLTGPGPASLAQREQANFPMFWLPSSLLDP